MVATKKAAAKPAPSKPAPAKKGHDPTRAMNAAMAKFDADMTKAFGEGAMIDFEDVPEYEVISTGSLSDDHALVVGGLIRGRQYEIWGPEHSGKTSLAFDIVAAHQAELPDLWGGYIDVEKRADKRWAIERGVDPRRMKLVRPTTSEDVADQLKMMLRSGLFSIVVIDSVGAMIAEAEIEKDAGDSAMGKNPGVITRMVKMATAFGEMHRTTVLYINQVRADLSGNKYVTQTTGGGYALKHCTTARLKTSRKGGSDIKVKMDGDEVIVGYTMAVKVERNSVGPAYRKAEPVMLTVPTEKHGPIGVDRADEAVTLGIRTGVFLQAGAWITDSTSGERWNGREKALASLRASPASVARIREAILATVAHEVTDESDETKAFRRGMSEAAGDDGVLPEGLAELAAQIEDLEGPAPDDDDKGDGE